MHLRPRSRSTFLQGLETSTGPAGGGGLSETQAVGKISCPGPETLDCCSPDAVELANYTAFGTRRGKRTGLRVPCNRRAGGFGAFFPKIFSFRYKDTFLFNFQGTSAVWAILTLPCFYGLRKFRSDDKRKKVRWIGLAYL